MLKVWNVVIVVGAFALALFGTFLTRSGIVSSIHSFTESSIGAWFLGFIVLVLAGSVYLVLSRLPLLRAKTRLESLVSREATFLYNNLLLVALCLTILWGSRLPDPLRGRARGADHGRRAYYNFFLVVFGLPLLLLMRIGPLIAWRRASLRSLGKSFIWPAAAARRRRHPARARCRLPRRPVSSPTPLRPSCSARSSTSSCGGRVRGGRSAAVPGCQRSAAGRSQPPALRRVRRARVDRAPGDWDCGVERVRHRPPAEAEPWATMATTTGSPIAISRSGRGRTPRSFARISTSSGTEVARVDPGRQERLPRGGPGHERGRHP